MATVTNFLAKPFPNLISTPKINLLNPNSTSQISFLPKPTTLRVKFDRNFTPKATSSVKTPSSAAAAVSDDDKVQQIHSVSDFIEALTLAKNKLVVVEFAALTSKQSSKIYPCMVNLSRTCDDVVFLLVMGDESELTRELCRREKIDKVPHFSFYKNMKKIHEEEGIGPDQLMGDVLYYGDNHSNVVQLDTRADLDKLIADPSNDNKLIVLKAVVMHCGPCISVYPTVVKLSKSMADTVTFARMHLDKKDCCMDFMMEQGVVEVPTFFFIKKGVICGRYVGSGRGELIGEILRYQGVRVTY